MILLYWNYGEAVVELESHVSNENQALKLPTYDCMTTKSKRHRTFVAHLFKANVSYRQTCRRNYFMVRMEKVFRFNFEMNASNNEVNGCIGNMRTPFSARCIDFNRFDAIAFNFLIINIVIVLSFNYPFNRRLSLPVMTVVHTLLGQWRTWNGYSNWLWDFLDFNNFVFLRFGEFSLNPMHRIVLTKVTNHSGKLLVHFHTY